MGTEVKSLKKSFYLALVGILLFLVSATGVTYAWFTLSGRAHTNITPMAGVISDGDTVLQISSAYTGPFDKTCDLPINGSNDLLKPVSTSNLEHFYKVTLQDKEGMAVLYEGVDDEIDSDTIHGTVYLRCLNVPCNVYFNRENLKLGSDSQALAAMRLGLKITSHSGSQTFIFKLDELGGSSSVQSVATVPRELSVVSEISEKGQAAYIDDPAENIGDYMALAVADDKEYNPGNKILVSLNADEVATVEYWLYLEGCDEHCSNPVQNKNTEIQLAFAGVDVNN